MSKHVAIVNTTGFDGGGIARLGIEYSKLGLDVYFKDMIHPLQFKPNEVANVKLYNTFDELVSFISKYDRLIFLTFYDKYLEVNVKQLMELRNTYPNMEICYLYCDRNNKRLIKLLDVLAKYNAEFDYYFSINPNIDDLVENVITLNVNAFTFPEASYNLKCRVRSNIVLTAGRTEAFKGVLNYFSSIDDEFLESSYKYIHEGARYRFNNTGTVSTPVQLLSLFDITKSPKQLKSQYAFKDYGEEPCCGKLTIYPSYNPDDIYKRWSHYYAGICCILGTKNKLVKRGNLFSNQWVVDDLRENNLMTKKLKLWTDAIEYANLEMIACGLPVLFSRKYAEVIGFDIEELIYNSFSEIPNKLDSLKMNYNEIRNAQYELFRLRQDKVNSNILDTFTKSLR